MELVNYYYSSFNATKVKTIFQLAMNYFLFFLI